MNERWLLEDAAAMYASWAVAVVLDICTRRDVAVISSLSKIFKPFAQTSILTVDGA